MTDPAADLADALRRENTALERHDFAAAGAALARKQMAAQRLNEARPGELAIGQARELMILAETNRRLLERAIAVQQQVIALVVRAASSSTTGRYDRRGAHTGAGARAYRASA